MPNEKKPGWGGRRKNAGRRHGEQDALPESIINEGFATKVFARIKELKLDNGRGGIIETAEDYQLDLLESKDIQVRSFNFNRLLDRKWGKPAQGTFIGDTREVSQPLTRGKLPSHFPAQQSSGTDKPN